MHKKIVANIEELIAKQKSVDAKFTTNKLLTSCNLAPSTLNDWRSGTGRIPVAALAQIADFFDVSIDELVGRATPGQSATNCSNLPDDPETQELLDGWRCLTPAQRGRVLGQVQILRDTPEAGTNPLTVRHAFEMGEARGRARAQVNREKKNENQNL